MERRDSNLWTSNQVLLAAADSLRTEVDLVFKSENMHQHIEFDNTWSYNWF